MSENKEIEKIIEDLQILEQQLQSILIEKQTLQAESNEVDNAISEVSKTSDEVYKILGGIMIRADKDSLLKELEEKRKITSIKVKALEKQEELVARKSDELRGEMQKSLSTNKHVAK
ncbi:MAG: prefoldin subunit beta [Nanoarchaeota archaeon]|nr:prefoldin subunit beta [Nanoarchaeota archaeon]